MTQDRALDILKTGGNVFLTGAPGAGKTHVINEYTTWLAAAGIPVAITASTGIAATHIGGMTIHSWSGIGTRDTITARDAETITGKEYISKRLRKPHVLIIDEISMLSAPLLDGVDRVLKAARSSDQPFGGLQVIFVGDFFQLPPITRGNEPIAYAFHSKAWQAAELLICYLHEQYRHEDQLLAGLLGAIRTDSISDDHYTLLSEQTDIDYEDIEPTRLYTHNAAVDQLNEQELARLSSPQKQFSMYTKGNKVLVETLVRSCLSPQTLTLREDALVMCTKNNFEAGFANGTLGRVIDFEPDSNDPIIKTSDGREIVVRPMSWSMQDQGKVLAEITQTPLRLAWAITVHKSQGMSLDAAELDLSRAFVYGQGYVALSRVRSLAGLKVSGMHPNALMIDPHIFEQDERFRIEADAADTTFAAMDQTELTALHKRFATTCGKRFPKEPTAGTPTVARPQNTYSETAERIEEGNSLHEIAKARSLTISTIVGHIEHLCEQGSVTPQVVRSLLPESSDTSGALTRLYAVFDEHGTDKLKPLYEATGGEFDYIYLRLVRCLYQLEKRNGAARTRS